MLSSLTHFRWFWSACPSHDWSHQGQKGRLHGHLQWTPFGLYFTWAHVIRYPTCLSFNVHFPCLPWYHCGTSSNFWTSVSACPLPSPPPVLIFSTLLVQSALPVTHCHSHLTNTSTSGTTTKAGFPSLKLDDIPNIHHLVENSSRFFLNVSNTIFSSSSILSCLIASTFFTVTQIRNCLSSHQVQ